MARLHSRGAGVEFHPDHGDWIAILGEAVSPSRPSTSSMPHPAPPPTRTTTSPPVPGLSTGPPRNYGQYASQPEHTQIAVCEGVDGWQPRSVLSAGGDRALVVEYLPVPAPTARVALTVRTVHP